MSITESEQRVSLCPLSAICRLLLTALVCFVIPCESISCVRCVTLVDKGCYDGSHPTRKCGNNDSYCITYVGTVNRRNIVFRDCVDKLLNVECSTDDDVRVKFCYNSCPVDGCNNKPISVSMSGRASSTGQWPGRSAVLLVINALVIVVCMSALTHVTS